MRPPWYYPPFLQQHPLTKDNLMHYFSMSHFFDPDSNNAFLMKQGNPLNMLDQMESGIEYVLSDTNTFVIQKRKKVKDKATVVVSVYFVRDGVIFQSPPIKQIIDEKLALTTLLLTEAFNSLSEGANLFYTRESDYSN